MTALFVLLILFGITLLFAAPAGVVVGLAVKQQKVAGLLKFGKLDPSTIRTVTPIVATGAILILSGKVPRPSRFVIILTLAFFIEAALIAYATYRVAVRKAAD
jgi:hypothetical protein